LAFLLLHAVFTFLSLHHVPAFLPLQGVVSPSDPGLSPSLLAQQMEQADTKLVFCCLDTLDRVRQALQLWGREVVVIVLDAAINAGGLKEGLEMSLQALLEDDKTLEYSDPPAPETVEEDELMLICWSSGTTGKPKGILHGPKVFFKILESQESPLRRCVQTTCMFHLGGFTLPLHALIQGSENVFIAGEDLEDDISLILKVAERCQADNILCGSHHLIQLASWHLPSDQQPAASVKLLVPAGTNVYHGIADKLKPLFPSSMGVMNLYGQSEGGTAVSYSLDQRHLGGVQGGPVRVVSTETGGLWGRQRYTCKSTPNSSCRMILSPHSPPFTCRSVR
jgi:acyl-coenzyme A synthetase/AMP-(fatty) acid ligase